MASKSLTFPIPKKPTRNRLERSYLILKYAHDTAESLLTTFDQIRGARGRPKDEEHDLLRAMVVFAGAGIDSMMKEIVRSALPGILNSDDAARVEFEKYASKRIQRVSTEEETTVAEAGLNMKLLGRLLAAESPRSVLVEILIDELTTGSLQSYRELARILAYLGIKPDTVGCSEASLRPVFTCRNEIIHELDIDFAQANANRRPRPKVRMVEYTRTLLSVSAQILAAVDGKLQPLA